jgi:hypothetical protein
MSRCKRMVGGEGAGEGRGWAALNHAKLRNVLQSVQGGRARIALYELSLSHGSPSLDLWRLVASQHHG